MLNVKSLSSLDAQMIFCVKQIFFFFQFGPQPIKARKGTGDFFLDFWISALLSAHIAIFSVSCMLNLSIINLFGQNTQITNLQFVVVFFLITY